MAADISEKICAFEHPRMLCGFTHAGSKSGPVIRACSRILPTRCACCRNPAKVVLHGELPVHGCRYIREDLHWEFAVEHDLRWLSRWKLVYYGCCEPLDSQRR